MFVFFGVVVREVFRNLWLVVVGVCLLIVILCWVLSRVWWGWWFCVVDDNGWKRLGLVVWCWWCGGSWIWRLLVCREEGVLGIIFMWFVGRVGGLSLVVSLR